MKTAVEWYEKALEVIDDPELEQKTMMFKMMADADPSFGEDYPEDDSDAEDGGIEKDGVIELTELQLAGKKKMDGKSFANGSRHLNGKVVE